MMSFQRVLFFSAKWAKTRLRAFAVQKQIFRLAIALHKETGKRRERERRDGSGGGRGRGGEREGTPQFQQLIHAPDSQQLL
jgi:hypothetical protein